MRKVKVGDTVTVNYVGKLEDGTIFDSSLTEGREPLKSTLGEGQLIPGFENELLEMSVGEKKTITISPQYAYGLKLDHLIFDVEKSQIPDGIKVGETLQANSSKGTVVVTVVQVNENSVTLDANHPLAGKELIFDLEVVDIIE